MPREDFEKLCFHLIKERHPNANVHHVEGASGDLGVDTFAGSLEEGPVIWQSKAFANGIGKSQKQQIRQSLRQAIQSFKPKAWILCLSIDMDIHTHKWFEQLARSYTSSVDTGLMQGGDIVSELMHRRTIRDYFFPDAGLNVNELRSLLTRTGEYTDEQAAALTEENASQYIERLKRRDARFNYEIVIATDRKPSPPAIGSAPTFSISSGSTVINAYPRDISALSLMPPRLKLRFKGPGAAKVEDYVKTGRTQSFGPGEVECLETDIFFPELITKIEKFAIGQSTEQKVLSTRIAFGASNRRIVYDLLQLKVSRAGQEEAELVSVGKLPFTLSLTIRKDDGGALNLTQRWTGARFSAVKKYLDALAAIHETHEIEVYDLESERRLFRARLEEPQQRIDPEFLALLYDGARIAEAFSPDLTVPATIGREDVQTIAFLKELLEGSSSCFKDPVGTLIKDGTEERWMMDIAQGNPVSLELNHPGLIRSFAGISIPTGPLQLIFDKIVFLNPDETIQRYVEVPIGSELQLEWQSVGYPRVKLRQLSV